MLFEKQTVKFTVLQCYNSSIFPIDSMINDLKVKHGVRLLIFLK